MQLTHQAHKHLQKFPHKDQARLKKALQAMQTEPLAGDVVKLTGHDAFRRRVGTYRILFTVVENEVVILVFDILRRNENTYK